MAGVFAGGGSGKDDRPILVAIYLGFYVLPFIVTLPASAPLIVLWREPPRFLFLRPFNRRPLTRGLSQLVRRDVARFGHTYTVADANIRVPWYVRIPLLFGQLALLSFRTRTVRRRQQLDALERALQRTWFRNINWCLSWRKIFPVASDDAWWHQVVERLVHRSTVVFIDLTEFRSNVLWEISLIRGLGLEHRVIYLLHHDSAARDLDAMREQLGYVPDGERLHFYDRRGVKDREGFQAAVAHGITEAWTEKAGGAVHPRGQLWSVAGVVLFVVGCLPLLALSLFPALYERLGYIPAVVFFYGLGTWVLLWVLAYWNHLMVFIALVQTLLLLGMLVLASI